VPAEEPAALLLQRRVERLTQVEGHVLAGAAHRVAGEGDDPIAQHDGDEDPADGQQEIRAAGGDAVDAHRQEQRNQPLEHPRDAERPDADREFAAVGAQERLQSEERFEHGLWPRPQNGALFGTRGKGITSRMFSMPVTYSTSRSRPRPKPACGTVP
jgi:hypothetical protein